MAIRCDNNSKKYTRDTAQLNFKHQQTHTSLGVMIIQEYKVKYV